MNESKSVNIQINILVNDKSRKLVYQINHQMSIYNKRRSRWYIHLPIKNVYTKELKKKKIKIMNQSQWPMYPLIFDNTYKWQIK